MRILSLSEEISAGILTLLAVPEGLNEDYI